MGESGMRRIVVLERYGEESREKIRACAPGWEVLMGRDEPDAKAALAEAEVVFGWTREVPEACLAEGTRLRWLQSASSGVDYVPMDAFERLEITLTTASGVHALPVAETALALMLGLARGFGPAGKDAANSFWNKKAAREYGLSSLGGNTLLILGAGQIGGKIAEFGKAFGMEVLGLSRSGGAHPAMDETHPQSEMMKLLPRADYVVNVLPQTPETQGLVGEEQFAAMKPSAFYISVGRGGTTNTADLIQALQSGAIAGAGLDVADPEPLPPESPLWQMRNVILLPHVAGFWPGREEATVALFCENLAAYIKTGKPAKNMVDYTKEY